MQHQQQRLARALVLSMSPSTSSIACRRRRSVLASAASPSSSSTAPKLTNKPAWAGESNPAARLEIGGKGAAGKGRDVFPNSGVDVDDDAKTGYVAPPSLSFLSLFFSLPTSSGDDPLSRFVNVLISIKPLYAAMKAGARVVLKNSAEKAGVPWDGAAAALARQPVAAELESIRSSLANPRVVYPDYYTQPFHAYDEGNLCWLAAREIEAATASMAIRTFRNSDPGIGPAEAQAKLREGIHSRIREYRSGEEERRRSGSSSSSSSGSGPLFEDILDVGAFLFSFFFILFIF